MKFTNKDLKTSYYNYLELFQRGLLTQEILTKLISNLEEKQTEINILNNKLCLKCNKKLRPLKNIDINLKNKSYCLKCYKEYKQLQELELFKYKNNI
jgi:hypothetical protein